MTYIKHGNKFYKEINLDVLTKKQLIEIIKESIEIQPQVVEKLSPFIKSPWRETEKRITSTNVQGKNTVMFTSTIDSNLEKLKVGELLSLVKNI